MSPLQLGPSAACYGCLTASDRAGAADCGRFLRRFFSSFQLRRQHQSHRRAEGRDLVAVGFEAQPSFDWLLSIGTSSIAVVKFETQMKSPDSAM